MPTLDDHLKDIAEVRSLMERSSKFLSLSGLSGISAGLVGLLGAAFAYTQTRELESLSTKAIDHTVVNLLLAALLVLILAVALAMYFSFQMARRKSLPLWTNVTRYLLMDLLLPLFTGGSLCLIFWYQSSFAYIAPATLVFYGLALLNASKFTVKEIRYLAVCEIILGLAAFLWLKQQLFFWSFGFGVLHIVYGILLYRKYEQ